MLSGQLVTSGVTTRAVCDMSTIPACSCSFLWCLLIILAGLDPFTPLALTHRWCHKLRGALSSLHTFFSHATHRHSSAATPTSAAAGIVGAKAVRGMIDAEALPPVGPGPLQGHRAATHVTLRRLLAGPVLTLGGSGVSDDDDFEPVSSGDDDGGDDDSSDSLLADNNDNEGDEAAILNEGDNEGE